MCRSVRARRLAQGAGAQGVVGVGIAAVVVVLRFVVMVLGPVVMVTVARSVVMGWGDLPTR